MKYFDMNYIKTLEDLKKQFKSLAKKYHPDLNKNQDTTEIMKEINTEYQILLKKFDKKKGFSNSNNEYNKERENNFTEIIETLIKYNVTIDIVGSWVWVYGEESKAIKEILKTLGFRWAMKKKKWFWHQEESYKKTSKKEFSYEEIQNYYGAEKIKEKEEPRKISA